MIERGSSDASSGNARRRPSLTVDSGGAHPRVPLLPRPPMDALPSRPAAGLGRVRVSLADHARRRSGVLRGLARERDHPHRRPGDLGGRIARRAPGLPDGVLGGRVGPGPGRLEADHRYGGTVAAFLFSFTWIALVSGSQVMPNFWTAVLGLVAAGFTLRWNESGRGTRTPCSPARRWRGPRWSGRPRRP